MAVEMILEDKFAENKVKLIAYLVENSLPYAEL